MSDFTDRLDRIEATLKLNQIPPELAVLQRKLEQNWQPDASVLLQAGSISGTLLTGVMDADGFGLTFGTVRVRWGTTTATWTAAVNSATVTVTHGLGKAAAYARPSSRNTVTEYALSGAPGALAASFAVIGYRTDAVAITATLTFDWLAIG